MRTYPEFVENSAFYQMDSKKDANEQQAAMLANLKECFILTTRSYKGLDELVRVYLKAGLNIFGFETGIVSRIESDTYTVVDVVSNQDVINKGDQYPLEGTYCSEVFQCGKVLGFPHVGELSYMKEHPVYVNLHLESYLSAPIKVDGEIYGTLNFTSTQKRESGFSEHERDLIVLMANAIGNFLLIRDRENKLNESNTQLKKLVGFVAHDIRNPVGTILSFAKMGLRDSTPTKRIPQLFESIERLSNLTLDFVASVLEISALGTGKIQAQLEAHPLSNLFTDAIASLEDLIQTEGSSIDLKLDEASVIADANLLIRAVTNLLMNAIKYSPHNSQIFVKTEISNDSLLISIINTIDDGAPGSDSLESRYQSVGFGLEIASEILQAHDSELRLEKSNSEFTASFKLALSP
ncbi:MAG: GAF domain-containing sensor histidine kinase [Agarilytica sp.]